MKDGMLCYYVDYRLFDEVTIKDAYLLSRLDDSLDTLNGSQYFSTLDLLSGYWQVALDQEIHERAAFVTSNGLWRWKVLTFGFTSEKSSPKFTLENSTHLPI